jgi:hypothetical protein
MCNYGNTKAEKELNKEIETRPIPVAGWFKERSVAVCLLGLRVRFPLREWTFFSCVCCVLCK